jgi:hypothetical protein
MPTEWRSANQLAHPPIELRRVDDVDDSECPVPIEYWRRFGSRRIFG